MRYIALSIIGVGFLGISVVFIFPPIPPSIPLTSIAAAEAIVHAHQLSHSVARVQEPSERPTEVLTLWIDRIGVVAPIVPVGLDPDGTMEIPKNIHTVGWYSLGPRPGNPGTAVLAGHLNAAGGVQGVFWKLHMLELGDRFALGFSRENAQEFQITERLSYPYDTAPLQEIFGSNGQTVVRLITCTGDWNRAEATYSERLVVSAVPVLGETAYQNE